jgi:hypothetical protein
MATITLHVRLAWWWKPYIYGLATMAALTGAEPNWDRVNYWIGRAMTLGCAKKPSTWQRLVRAWRRWTAK